MEEYKHNLSELFSEAPQMYDNDGIMALWGKKTKKSLIEIAHI